jgi:glycine/D-amino acid oxidase-like deaminating enzyme
VTSVVVVGAGICGAACANELHQRGIDVLLLDRGGVAMETTGLGEGNVLVSDKPAGPELDLAFAGRAVWHELAGRFPGAVKLRAKGALVLYEEDGAAAHAARLDEAEHVTAPHEIEPALAPGLEAVLVPGDLQVDPRATAQALAAEVPTRTGAKVVGITPGEGVTLVTGERIAADAVVLAAGPWSGPLALRAGLRLPVAPRKGQLIALGPAPGLVRHKCIEGSYLRFGAGVASVIEEAVTGEVYVGSSREWAEFDDTVDPAVSDALHARAARFMPALRDLPRTRAWAGFRPALAGGPAIGRAADGLYVSTGHEGAGVALGPISGRIVAQLIAGEPPALDPSPFDPTRFAPASA